MSGMLSPEEFKALSKKPLEEGEEWLWIRYKFSERAKKVVRDNQGSIYPVNGGWWVFLRNVVAIRDYKDASSGRLMGNAEEHIFLNGETLVRYTYGEAWSPERTNIVAALMGKKTAYPSASEPGQKDTL